MKTILISPFLLAGLVCMTAPAPRAAFACPSDLDLAFGTDGIAQMDIGTGLSGVGQSVQSLASGELLVGGTVNNGAAILRYDADGNLDPDFGSDGIARLDYVSFFDGIDVTGSGEIVAGGGDGNGNIPTDFLVARFGSEGLPDLSFGQNGVVTTSIGPGNSWIRDIVLLGDGRLVAVGQSRKNDFEWNVTVACYDEAGVLDPSFGSAGIVTFSPNGQSAIATGVARADNDSVIISLLIDGGESGVAKLLSNGEFDPSFGTDGIRVSPSRVYEEAWAIGMDALGRIYVGGNSSAPHTDERRARLFARRYLPNGKPDAAYGRGGKTRMPATRRVGARALTVSPAGVVTVVGFNGRSRKGLLARFTPDGDRDVTFGRHGLATLKVGDGASLWGVGLQDDGKLLVTGSAGPGPLLVRYDGQWDGNGECVIGCGDGVLSRFEDCDDGNIENGDGCSAACFLELTLDGANHSLD